MPMVDRESHGELRQSLLKEDHESEVPFSMSTCFAMVIQGHLLVRNVMTVVRIDPNIAVRGEVYRWLQDSVVVQVYSAAKSSNDCWLHKAKHQTNACPRSLHPTGYPQILVENPR